uniref:Uncharacterized protein n=1 Tax=Chromera velia CCMP2878 TaxID=1169474 RepID=A0A0G4I5S0_9ALVE|eukprot:Cvel_54.t1-p1 / transcript=Cvel_54.t1 / gene=Cvel_54 / organism=Chromera_velia_CCMP2878 / gene_product=hypothetical protein / transcript_product=hypothetical protein / location=Cvel_scaffold6:14267-20154(+) / protein_length=524 / sequence_SO=supercontig / SO=protein_coding / is_pseudo=false
MDTFTLCAVLKELDVDGASGCPRVPIFLREIEKAVLRTVLMKARTGSTIEKMDKLGELASLLVAPWEAERAMRDSIQVSLEHKNFLTVLPFWTSFFVWMTKRGGLNDCTPRGRAAMVSILSILLFIEQTEGVTGRIALTVRTSILPDAMDLEAEANLSLIENKAPVFSLPREAYELYKPKVALRLSLSLIEEEERTHVQAVGNVKGETADADGGDKDETTLPPYVDPLCLISAPPHRLQSPAPAQVGAESPSTIVEVEVMPSLPSVKLSSSDAACEQPLATENGGSRGFAPTPSLSPVRSPARCDSVARQPSPVPREATEVKEEVPSHIKEHPVFPFSQQSTPLPLQGESKEKKKKARPSARRHACSRTCVPEEIQPEASIPASSSSPNASHQNVGAPSDPLPCEDVPRYIRSDDQPEAVSPVVVDEDGEGLHCSTISAAPATAYQSKLQASPSPSNPNNQVDPPVPLAQSSAAMTESAFVSPSPTAQVRDESRAPFPATQQIVPEPTSSTALPLSSSVTCISK